MPILNLRDNPGLFDDTVSLHHSYLNESGVPDYKYDGTVNDTRAKVWETLDNGRDYLLSVTPDNISQWYACGEESNEVGSVYETVWLYVKPELRWMGIGYKLKEEQIRIVKEMGKYQWMYSKCHASNEASLRLLQRLGFQIFWNEEEEWYMGWLLLGTKKDTLYERIFW